MRTSPVQPSCDASQRKPLCTSAAAGAWAADGDASERNPRGSGRVSLGVAILGGDASQRSPPGCSFGSTRPWSLTGQQRMFQAPVTESVIPMNASVPQGITGTPSPLSPASSSSSVTRDASQRAPSGDSPTNSAINASNETLKSWLLGDSTCGVLINDIDLAERLRAAAPE